MSHFENTVPHERGYWFLFPSN